MPLAALTPSFDSPSFENKQIYEDIVFIAPFLVSSSHETFVKKYHCFFWGGVLESVEGWGGGGGGGGGGRGVGGVEGAAGV